MSADHVIGNTQVRPLSGLGSAVKLSEREADALREKIDQQISSGIEADNDPRQLYATIKKDGQTIATFYASGLMLTSPGIPLPQGLANDGRGTSLADIRIRQMLAELGGSVEYLRDAERRAKSESAATLFAAQIAGR